MAKDEAQLLAMGERIRQLRLSHGYKQQWIADQCGVQLRTYQFWQAGKSPPEQENLEALAKLFGVTPTYILRGETPDLAPQPGVEVQLAELTRMVSELSAQLHDMQAAQGAASASVVEVMRLLDDRLPPIRESQRRRQQ